MHRSLLASAAVLAAALPASADILHFIAEMDGLQEVPPVSTPATGFANITLDTVTGQVSVSGTYQSLLANVTAAHIHGLAPIGTNAGVIVPLTPSGGTSGTLVGMGMLNSTQVQGMINGMTYINVHTSLHPPGEIRGQILVPAPGAGALLAVAGIAAVRRRRRS